MKPPTAPLTEQEIPPHAKNGKKGIFIVDDHPLVREWLAILINQQPDLKVCGEAGGAAEGLALIAAAKPDVAIVDISLEGKSGIELISDIKAICPEVSSIVLTMHDEAIYAERALRAGARGYIMKREATKNVLPAIRCVLEGKLYLTEKIARMMAEKFVDGKSSMSSSPEVLLSDRELQVFRLLGRGYGTRQIAEELHVGFKTAQTFRSRIKEKLKLANATELLTEAIRWHESQGLK
jgi:DNA-binding NarL/FixJ family response regulator